MKRDERSRLIRIGVFLTLSIGLLVVAVFLLGRSQTLFAHRARLHAAFQNTSGLVVGAPVRLAGVDVGVVEAIRFDPDLHQKNVLVTLAVERRYLDRIREDSIARLASKGLLGDMIINVTVGSAEAKALTDGATVRSQESEGLTEVISSLQDGIAEVRSLAGIVGKRVDAVLTDQLGRDVGRIAGAAADVAEHAQRGDGLIHALVYDPRMTRQAEHFLGDARHVVVSADAAVARVDHLLADVQHGDGTLHGLIYRDDGQKLIAELQGAARDLTGVIGEIRAGHGMLHSLIYEKDEHNLVENLTEVSRILRQIGVDVQEGKGTVGALLQDPSVYEDLKTILGNIKRNRLLKSLVRYTITKDGLGAKTTP